MHNVPEHFVIPRMTLQTLITSWYCGSTQPLVPPLKYAKSYDFPGKTMKFTLSQMKRIMTKVEQAARWVNFDMSSGMHNTAKATQLYMAIEAFFLFPTIKHRRRYESIAWKTYFNAMIKNQGKLVGER